MDRETDRRPLDCFPLIGSLNIEEVREVLARFYGLSLSFSRRSKSYVRLNN